MTTGNAISAGLPLAAAAAIGMLLTDFAHAETPQLRCFTNGTINVNTLPIATDKLWHQADALGKTYKQASAIWDQLPPGTFVGVYVSYVERGVEWDWISGAIGDATISGWVRRSQLKCD